MLYIFIWILCTQIHGRRHGYLNQLCITYDAAVSGALDQTRVQKHRHSYSVAWRSLHTASLLRLTVPSMNPSCITQTNIFIKTGTRRGFPYSALNLSFKANIFLNAMHNKFSVFTTRNLSSFLTRVLFPWGWGDDIIL